jgi:hypothetical protein
VPLAWIAGAARATVFFSVRLQGVFCWSQTRSDCPVLTRVDIADFGQPIIQFARGSTWTIYKSDWPLRQVALVLPATLSGRNASKNDWTVDDWGTDIDVSLIASRAG